jgi:hypothetical protein
VIESKLLRRIYGPERNEVAVKLHSLYSSSNIIASRRTIWAEHETHMREMKNVHKISVRKAEGKIPPGRSRRKWNDNIKMDLQEMSYFRGRLL